VRVIQHIYRRLLYKPYIGKAKHIYMLLALFVAYSAHSQNKFVIINRPLKDRILLRWIPPTPLSWKYANKYGYMIERTTVTRDGVILTTPEKKTLTGNKILPRPIEDWKTIPDSNTFSTVLYQAIYGDSFNVVTGKNIDKNSNISVKSKEAQLRFGFGMYCADHNYTAACYAGLGYTDFDVKPGEKYLYKIYTLIPDSILKVESNGVYTGVDEYEELPSNNTLKANFGDHFVMLNWDYDRYRRAYNSYIIERSIDSIEYKAVNTNPFVDLNKGTQKSTHSYFTDSLSENDRYYFYRIRGINPFGELGPPSNTVKGIGIGALKENPFIKLADLVSDSIVYIEWNFSKQMEPAVRSFQLLVSRSYKGKYKEAIINITANSRSMLYKHTEKFEGAYYFKIAAIGAATKRTESFPVFVQTIDSIPPRAPAAVKAVINDKGIIKVNWKKNIEKDLNGYRLFRATHKYEEYSAVFSTIIKDSFYTDTVQMTMLNDTVYYYLIAIDKRGNMSKDGKISFAIKPDIIPPAPSFFKSYEIVDKGIFLTWDYSPSTDVVEYILKRVEGADTSKMKLLKKWNPKDSIREYTDNTVKHDKLYTYQLDVKDKTRLISKNQHISLRFYKISEMIKPAVKGLDALYDEKLNTATLIWSYNQKDVEEFRIYRGRAGEPMTMWQVVDSNVFNVKDDNIIHDKEYIYGIIARFKDGTQSKLSKIKKIY
jgi:hypothetical protein